MVDFLFCFAFFNFLFNAVLPPGLGDTVGSTEPHRCPRLGPTTWWQVPTLGAGLGSRLSGTRPGQVAEGGPGGNEAPGPRMPCHWPIRLRSPNTNSEIKFLQTKAAATGRSPQVPGPSERGFLGGGSGRTSLERPSRKK